MKQVFFLAIFFFSMGFATEAAAQKGKCWSLIGYWESDYFEYKSMDYTSSYQFKMRFTDDSNCNITLVKPGGEITHNLPYSITPKCTTLKMGDFVMTIEKFQWADELVLSYQSGITPSGYITPFKVKMRLLEQ